MEFKQANLANKAMCEKVFIDGDGSGFDYVFHLAAETKYGQTNEVRNRGFCICMVRVCILWINRGLTNTIFDPCIIVYDFVKQLHFNVCLFPIQFIHSVISYSEHALYWSSIETIYH